MGTSEEGSNPPLETQNEEINLEPSSNGTHIVHGDDDDHQNQNPVEEESAIVEQLYNLELRSDAKEEEGGGGEGEFQNYPFRPNATDCAFFIRTGTCKYGPNCRFNHPPKRVFELAGEENGGTEQLNEVVSDTQWKIECKYFSTPGGCKYGDACTYNHPSEEIGMAYLELNFLGLPIRPMEKECTFFMRTGKCAYGAKCRFNHPDPSAANHPMPGNSLANGYSSRVDNGFPKTNGTMNYSGGFQGTLSNGMNSRNSAPYASNMGSNYQVIPPNHGWNQNQVNVSLPANKLALPHQIVDLSKKQDPSTNYERLMQIEEFPERPGQPDCEFFMKTGDCKYRSACRYNHPMSRSSKLPLPPLSSKGLYSRSAKMPPAETMDLHNSYSGNARNNGMRFDNNQKMNNGGYPERPGQPECEYFMKTGSCKFNSACRYHHPRNHVPESSPCALSDKGLPLRPGAKICRNYEHQGTCQYGIRCLFHHPDNVSAQVAAPDNHKNSSTSAAVSIPEPAFSDNVKHPSTSVAVSNLEPGTDWDDGWVM